MFRIDDIVFARLEGFPFWPARVISAESHHLTSLRMNEIPPNQRLVLFYNDKGRYAAMDNSDLRSFDDLHMQRRTRDYDGTYKSQLHTAFEAALEQYSAQRPTNHHSSVTDSPHRKPRPNKLTSSDLTSPVTGHSESRQTTRSKTSKPAKQLTHRSAPLPESPPQNLRKRPTARTMASRTHPDSSPSTHPPQPQNHSSHNHPCLFHISKRSEPSHSHPPQSKQSQNFPASIQLRLRIKRKSTASDDDLNPSSLNPSTQRPGHQSVVPQPKRKRPGKSDRTKEREQFPTACSERDSYEDTTTHDKPHASKENDKSAEAHTEKVRSNNKCDTRSSGERGRIPHSKARKELRRADETSDRITDNVRTSRKSRFDRNESRGTGSEEVLAQSSSEPDSEQPYRGRERKRSSKVRTRQVGDIGVGGEPHSKKMRPASKHSLSAKRSRRSHEIQRTRMRKVHVKGEGTEEMIENGESMEWEQIPKPTKQRKTDGNLGNASSLLHKLSKAECIEVIEQMQLTLRYTYMDLWRRGYKLAEAKNIVKTEEGLTAACSCAVQKAEELLKVMQCENEDQSELVEREAEAYEACKALRDIYFDTEKVSLIKLGKRILEVAKELTSYSRPVSTALRDLLVMWSDLTVGYGQREMNGKEEKNGDDGGENKQKRSAREERMQKFDRKTFFNALVCVLKEDLGKRLKLEEKQRLLFVRRLEREIRPTFEDDREGYYEASVKVIRGIQKARKHLAVKGDKHEDEKKYPHMALFIDAVDAINSSIKDDIKDQSQDKMRLLVTCLTER